MRTTSILAAGVLAASAAAENYLGFNSGATLTDRSAKFKQDFVDEFKAAKNLENAPGDFTAVRLYTNIQAYAEDDPIEAFEAAIETDTKILLGVWASGVTNIDKELTALGKAVEKHGKDLTDLIIGISIGSEDLYRESVTGIKNESGVGNSPQAILRFIDDFKKKFKDTALSSVPVGYVCILPSLPMYHTAVSPGQGTHSSKDPLSLAPHRNPGPLHRGGPPGLTRDHQHFFMPHFSQLNELKANTHRVTSIRGILGPKAAMRTS